MTTVQMLTDSHIHFDMVMEYTGLGAEEILREYDSAGIRRAIQVSIEPAGYAWSRNFARENTSRGIHFSLGIHPSSPAGEEDLQVLERFTVETLNSPDRDLLAAIGECGLDFYRMRQDEATQRRSFEFQLDLAARSGLPVIIHSRDATEATLDILERRGGCHGIMHCFPGNAADARRFLDLGMFISFAGNVTYKAAVPIQEAAAYVPIDRILVETDAPFLTPVPLRGQTNRCGYIRHTYDFIAGLRSIDTMILRERVAENLQSLVQRS